MKFGICILLINLLFSLDIRSQDTSKISFYILNSKYRKLDKECGNVPQTLKKYLLKEVGIGNVIFSDKPFYVEKEDEYLIVTNNFNFNNIKNGFYALAYFPGTIRDLVKYIVIKFPSMQYEGVYADLIWLPHSSPDKKQYGTIIPYEYNAMQYDQEKFKILPEINNSGFKELNLLDIPKYGSLEHTIEMNVFLRFSTGTINVGLSGIDSGLDLTLVEDSKEEAKIQKRIYKRGDTTHNEEPLYRDFLVSLGKCTVTYLKK